MCFYQFASLGGRRSLAFSIVSIVAGLIITPHAAAQSPETQPAPPEDAPETQESPAPAPEWFGGETPWTQWTRASGDWDGLRTRLEEQGLTFDITFIGDYGGVLGGGIRRRTAAREYSDITLTFDLDPLIGLEGGSFQAQYMQHSGRDNACDAGDAQFFDNIEDDDFSHLNQLWYEQILFDDLLRIKAGLVDANDEYGYGVYRAEFVNTSMAYSPTFFTIPTYRDPATSVNVWVYPASFLYIGAGVFDGSTATSTRTGDHGRKTFLDNSKNLLAVGEIGANWVAGEGYDGKLVFGLWHHNGTFPVFGGGTQSGTTGWHASLDHKVWRESPDAAGDNQGIGAFTQFGWTDEDVAFIRAHAGAGVAWEGAFAGRDSDILGFGFTHAVFSEEPGAGAADGAETAFELFYKLQLTPSVSVKPDLQYILNPSGAAGVHDAVVALVRLEISF